MLYLQGWKRPPWMWGIIKERKERKKETHHFHPLSVFCIVSLLMQLSDMMPPPLGELKILPLAHFKPLLPHRVKLPGGQADSDKLTMDECSTSHLQPFFLKMHPLYPFFSFSVEQERQKDKGWLTKITINPPVTLYMKTHLLIWRPCHRDVGQGRAADHLDIYWTTWSVLWQITHWHWDWKYNIDTDGQRCSTFPRHGLLAWSVNCFCPATTHIWAANSGWAEIWGCYSRNS